MCAVNRRPRRAVDSGEGGLHCNLRCRGSGWASWNRHSRRGRRRTRDPGPSRRAAGLFPFNRAGAQWCSEEPGPCHSSPHGSESTAPPGSLGLDRHRVCARAGVESAVTRAAPHGCLRTQPRNDATLRLCNSPALHKRASGWPLAAPMGGVESYSSQAVPSSSGQGGLVRGDPRSRTRASGSAAASNDERVSRETWAVRRLSEWMNSGRDLSRGYSGRLENAVF